MSLNANALTTLARQKIYMGITNTSSDARLEMLINSVSAYIEKICGRKFKQQTYTNEIYNGLNNGQLFLRNGPLTPGSSVSLGYRSSPVNEDTWQGVDATDFFIDYSQGFLSLTAGDSWSSGIVQDWNGGVQNWRVTYTGGYILPSDDSFGDDPDEDLPADLEMVVWTLVAGGFKSAQNVGVQKAKVRDIEVTYASTLATDPLLRTTLMSYRRRKYA